MISKHWSQQCRVRYMQIVCKSSLFAIDRPHCARRGHACVQALWPKIGGFRQKSYALFPRLPRSSWEPISTNRARVFCSTLSEDNFEHCKSDEMKGRRVRNLSLSLGKKQPGAIAFACRHAGPGVGRTLFIICPREGSPQQAPERPAQPRDHETLLK